MLVIDDDIITIYDSKLCRHTSLIPWNIILSQTQNNRKQTSKRNFTYLLINCFGTYLAVKSWRAGGTFVERLYPGTFYWNLMYCTNNTRCIFSIFWMLWQHTFSTSLGISWQLVHKHHGNSLVFQLATWGTTSTSSSELSNLCSSELKFGFKGWYIKLFLSMFQNSKLTI